MAPPEGAPAAVAPQGGADPPGRTKLVRRADAPPHLVCDSRYVEPIQTHAGGVPHGSGIRGRVMPSRGCRSRCRAAADSSRAQQQGEEQLYLLLRFRPLLVVAERLRYGPREMDD